MHKFEKIDNNSACSAKPISCFLFTSRVRRKSLFYFISRAILSIYVS